MSLTCNQICNKGCLLTLIVLEDSHALYNFKERNFTKIYLQINVWNNDTAAWPLANPVITCGLLSDAGLPSNFVADPFLYVQVNLDVYTILYFVFICFFYLECSVSIVVVIDICYAVRL